MNLKKAVFLFGFAIVMMAVAQIVFAEEGIVTPIDSGVITSSQQAASQKENDMQWAWGEVINLDDQAKTVTLKYLDYETDQEKELVLVIDEKTTFENIKDFNELKLNDTLSIDYVVGADNKNIAKNISFEKEDVLSSDSAQIVVPDLAQSTTQVETPLDPAIAANEESSPEPEPVPVVQEEEQTQ